MRDPDRIENVLLTIVQAWEQNPDLRLGQLILNAVPEDELYYAEDQKIVDKITELYLTPSLRVLH